MPLPPSAEAGGAGEAGEAREAAGTGSISADLLGILDTLDLPIVVVDRDLRIARFNQAATGVLGLTSSDIGQFPGRTPALSEGMDVERLCKQAITDEAPCRGEIRTRDKLFILRIAPYRQIGGAVLTFTNVTAFRASIEQAIYEREYTKTILNTVSGPLVVLDAELRVQTANRTFYAMFQVSREETQGVPIYALRNHLWRAPRLWTLLKETLSGNHEFQTFEVEHEFPAIGCRTVALDARRLPREGHSGYLILLAFQDITERKRAEEALRQRTAQFETLLNEAPLGVYLIDGEFRVREVNPTAARVFGYLPDLIGRDFNEVIHVLWPEAYADEIVQRFRHTLETGEPYSIPERIEERRDRGVIEYYEWQINRIPLPDGGYGVVCYFRDISAQVFARQKISESEAHFRALVTASSDVVFRMNPDWREMRHLIGKDFIADTEEPSGAWLEKYIHPDDQPRVLAAIREAVRTRSTFELEHRVLRADGTLGWTFSRAVPLLDPKGEIVEWIGAASDITERKRAEEALRHSEEQMRRAQEAAHLGNWDWDLTSDTVTWSKGIYELLGLAPGSIVPSFVRWLEFILPEDLASAQQSAREAQARGGEFAFEFRIRRADGAVRWLSSIGRVEAGPDGRNRRMLGVNIDVTDRKRIEEEREASLARERVARAAAEDASHAKDEFLAVVSHELRSPLNSILGWNRMMRSNYADDPEIVKISEVVERAGRAQLRLIEDLLDTARIISGKLRLEVGPVEPARVIATAIGTITPAAESKGIVIVPMLDPEVQITGDPERLQQVVWNLILNAVKFTPSGGRIEVELRRGLSDVRIIVRDTGTGIAPDLLPYVFDRFRQGDSTVSRRFGGLGLGLALVKHLVELHGGTVQVESPEGHWSTTFTVCLPVRAVLARAGEKAAPTPRPAERRLDGRHVLVVDDEADARELVAVTLTMSGALVTQADSAIAALAAIEKSAGHLQFDIVVSDIGMPEEDGYSLMRNIRSLPGERLSRIPAIALTAYSRAEDRIKALKAGYHVHLAKPVDQEELLIVVEGLIDREEEDRHDSD